MTEVSLELEHAIGFAGSVMDAVRCFPDGETIAFVAGAAVVLGKRDDPHDQVFLRGHTDSLSAIALSGSGRLVASAQRGKVADVCVWDAETYELLYRLEEHDATVNSVCFSDDERLLATVSGMPECQMIVWDLATGAIVSRVRTPGALRSVLGGGFVLDIKHHATGLYQWASVGSEGVHLWATNPLTGEMVSVGVKLPRGGVKERSFDAVTFSPDAAMLFAGTSSGEVVSIDVRRTSVIQTLHVAGGGVTAVSLCGIPNTLAVGAGDGTLAVLTYNPENGALTHASSISVGHGGVSSIAAASEAGEDGRGGDGGGEERGRGGGGGGKGDIGSSGAGCVLVVGTRESTLVSVALHRVVGGVGGGVLGSSEESFRGDVSVVCRAHASAGAAVEDGVGAVGAIAAAGGGEGGKAAVALAGESRVAGAVVSVSFPPDVSDSFATCGEDNTIRLWSAADYSVVAQTQVRGAGHPRVISTSADLLVAGMENGELRGFDALDLEPLWSVKDAHPGGATALEVASNQRFLLSGGEMGAVRLWELRSRELISDFREHSGRVTQVLLYDDQAHALSCSRDRSFMCWDLRRERRVSAHTQRMGGISGIALSNDQSLIGTVGQEKRLSFWDLREPQPVQVISPVHGDAEATCIAAAHGGDFFATGGADASVKLWDIRAGKAIHTGIGHSSRIRRVLFSNDDKQLISVGDDGCILIWNIYAPEE